MILENEAKSILRKHKRVDSWFLSATGFNLYRGCSHNCIYCDGRAEKYQVSGEFGADIGVKLNAPELLQRELDPTRKRKPLRPGYLCLGGGVGDSYQSVEAKYRLARQALEIALAYNRPVHVLTKSSLVERDLDILEKINSQSRAILSMSFSSMDDEIAQWTEPRASLPSQRLKTLAIAKARGLAIGMYLMPVIPFITDSSERIEECIKQAGAIGIDFIMFGGMTLKTGRQKDYFTQNLPSGYQDFVPQYTALYPESPWGNAVVGYYEKISSIFYQLAKKFKIPTRIPPRLYKDMLWENDKVMVMLEHLEYLSRLERWPFSCWKAIRSIGQLTTPLSQWTGSLQSLPGVTGAVERSVQEIITTGTHHYLERKMA